MILPLVFLGLFLISPANSQQPQVGVSVQLPVVRTFSIQTAVRVPDGGTMSLGGVSRSAEGRRSSGVPGVAGPLSRPFRNSGIGRTTSSGRATVTTKIVSQRELEAKLLGESGGNRPALASGASSSAAGPIVSVSPKIEKLANFITMNIGRRLKR